MVLPYVGHVDADCFYVSAERIRDGFLIGKPVGVLGNQGACVIAKSYEMKAAGVKTGEPIWEAAAKCPQGLYLKRDFRWYEVLSRKMLGEVKGLSPQVEYYSIDEFFFSVDQAMPEDCQRLAETVRAKLMQAVGVPATVGIARSRTLAKLVSDNAKPFGASTVLGPEAERALLTGRPVSEITGIGGRRAARLAAAGIKTCLDLAEARPSVVRALLTVVGERLCWELKGEPVQPIVTKRAAHKTISRGGSIGGASSDPAVIWAWLVRNLERLVEELEYHQVQAGKLTVLVEHQREIVRGGVAGLAVPSDRFEILLDAARYAFHEAWLPDIPVTGLDLIADRLQHRQARQLGLFDQPAEQSEAVAKLKHEVNGEHGRFALRSAATLPLPEIYCDPAHSFEICDIHEKSCF